MKRTPEMEIVRLRDQIISLETKNNLLLLKHKQLEKILNYEYEQKRTNEELDILHSSIKLLQQNAANREQYITHLESLLEFFVWNKSLTVKLYKD